MYTAAVSINTYFKMITGYVHCIHIHVPTEIHHSLNQSPIFND